MPSLEHILLSSQKQRPLLKTFVQSLTKPLVSAQLLKAIQLKNREKSLQNIVVK